MSPGEGTEGAGTSGSSHLLEMQVLKGEVSLYDARGLHPGSQHILLGGNVVPSGYPLQVVQVATERTQRRLSARPGKGCGSEGSPLRATAQIECCGGKEKGWTQHCIGSRGVQTH